jgi:hypothetical protein
MSTWICEDLQGVCTGPFNTLLDAQNAAAAAQAADVAADPATLSAGTTTDALTYYVIQTVTITKNVSGVLFVNSSQRINNSYVVKLLS